jgi:hypothetical protein
MSRLIVSFCALLAYGSLGAASIVGEPQRAAEPLRGEEPARAEAAEDTVLQAPSDATTAVPMQTMSDEEKDRRRGVCDRIFKNCNDKCKRFYDNPKFYEKLQPCRRQCSVDNSECLKEID